MQDNKDSDIHAGLPALRVARLLTERGLTVATAESCTGGLLSAALTEVPGSSAYFPGGIIAYDNEVKRTQLGVRQETIGEHGAVSAQVALEMANRVRSMLGSDIGMAVTGIAGPGGGTLAKPVGTTFVALIADAFEDVRRFQFEGDRSGNRAASVQSALTMLASYLETRVLHVEASATRNEVPLW